MFRAAVFLALTAVLPATAQSAASVALRLAQPVILAIPEYYPAFDPAMRAAHPESVELHAVVDHRVWFERGATDTFTVVLLNPAHLDAATLRAALVRVHNFRARTAPQVEAPHPSAIGNPGALIGVPSWMRRLLEGTLEGLRNRPTEELGHYGRVRKITIADPSAAVRPPASGREE